MNFKHTTRLLLVALLLASPAGPALAQWELDSERSAINFVSIKNDAVGELHHFDSLVGYISADGGVSVNIDLNSVQTLIDIRNERMREMLFNTVKFPTATASAELDPALLSAAAAGGTMTAEIPVTLALHGFERTLPVPVVVISEEGGQMQVFTAKPVLVGAADFGLEGGVNALREIAGLRAISNSVPVTLHLVFRPAE